MWHFKKENFSPGTVGHCKELQHKDARLRSWLSPSSPGFLPRSPPQGANAAHAGRRGAFAALPGPAAARGYSQGKNLVSHLLHPSSLSFPPGSEATINETGDEKVAEGRKEDRSGNLILQSVIDLPLSCLSHPIMVLSFQIVAFFLPFLQLGFTLKHQL